MVSFVKPGEYEDLQRPTVKPLESTSYFSLSARIDGIAKATHDFHYAVLEMIIKHADMKHAAAATGGTLGSLHTASVTKLSDHVFARPPFCCHYHCSISICAVGQLSAEAMALTRRLK